MSESKTVEAARVKENIEAIEGVVAVRDSEYSEKLSRFKTLSKMFDNGSWNSAMLEADMGTHSMKERWSAAENVKNPAAMVYRAPNGEGCVVYFDADVAGISEKLKAVLPENTPYEFTGALHARSMNYTASKDNNDGFRL